MLTDLEKQLVEALADAQPLATVWMAHYQNQHEAPTIFPIHKTIADKISAALAAAREKEKREPHHDG